MSIFKFKTKIFLINELVNTEFTSSMRDAYYANPLVREITGKLIRGEEDGREALERELWRMHCKSVLSLEPDHCLMSLVERTMRFPTDEMALRQHAFTEGRGDSRNLFGESRTLPPRPEHDLDIEKLYLLSKVVARLGHTLTKLAAQEEEKWCYWGETDTLVLLRDIRSTLFLGDNFKLTKCFSRSPVILRAQVVVLILDIQESAQYRDSMRLRNIKRSLADDAGRQVISKSELMWAARATCSSRQHPDDDGQDDGLSFLADFVEEFETAPPVEEKDDPLARYRIQLRLWMYANDLGSAKPSVEKAPTFWELAELKFKGMEGLAPWRKEELRMEVKFGLEEEAIQKKWDQEALAEFRDLEANIRTRSGGRGEAALELPRELERLRSMAFGSIWVIHGILATWLPAYF